MSKEPAAAPVANAPAPAPAAAGSAAPTGAPGAAGREFDVGFPLHTLATAGEWLVAAGGGGEAKTGITNGIVVFKWLKRCLVRVLTHDTGAAAYHRLALHPSEPLCAAVTLQGELTVFSFGAEGVQVRGAREAGAGVTSSVKLVAFARQGDELATLDAADQLRALAFPSLRTRAAWAAPPGTCDVALAPAGDVVYALAERELRVFSRTGQPLHRIERPLADGAVFRALACGADGRVVVSAMRKPSGGRGAQRKAGASFVQVYETSRAPELRGVLQPVGRLMKLATHHTCLGASGDGRLVALGTDEGGVHTFRTDYYTLAAAAPRVHEWVVSAVCFDPTGRAVASSSVAYTVRVTKVFATTRSYWNILLAALLLVLLFYVFATVVQPTVVRLLGMMQ